MLIDNVRISEGGIAGTVVAQRKIFKHVIDAYGTGLIIKSSSDLCFAEKIKLKSKQVYSLSHITY